MMSREVECIAGHGVKMHERLLARVKPKGKWRPGAWGQIISALKDEAQFFEECEPQSVCAFAFLAETAAMYLEDHHDKMLLRELCELVSKHLLLCAYKASTMSEEVLCTTEKEVMRLSLEGLIKVINNLHELYPGTP